MGSLGQYLRSRQIRSSRASMFMLAAALLGFGYILFGGMGLAVGTLGAIACIVSGVLFVVLGALTFRFPSICTMVGLVLFVLLNVFFAFLSPMTLMSGWVLKIIVAVALFKGVVAAGAFERTQRWQRESSLANQGETL